MAKPKRDRTSGTATPSKDDDPDSPQKKRVAVDRSGESKPSSRSRTPSSSGSAESGSDSESSSGPRGTFKNSVPDVRVLPARAGRGKMMKELIERGIELREGDDEIFGGEGSLDEDSSYYGSSEESDASSSAPRRRGSKKPRPSASTAGDEEGAEEEEGTSETSDEDSFSETDSDFSAAEDVGRLDDLPSDIEERQITKQERLARRREKEAAREKQRKVRATVADGKRSGGGGDGEHSMLRRPRKPSSLSQEQRMRIGQATADMNRATLQLREQATEDQQALDAKRNRRLLARRKNREAVAGSVGYHSSRKFLDAHRSSTGVSFRGELPPTLRAMLAPAADVATPGPCVVSGKRGRYKDPLTNAPY